MIRKTTGFTITGVNMKAYCKCGAKIAVQGGLKAVENAIKMWRQSHQGDGHGPRNAREASQARRRYENKAIKQENQKALEF
jgi:hypothetical protein